LQGIAAMASPAQVAPAARAILSSSLSGAEIPGGVAALTGALRKMVALRPLVQLLFAGRRRAGICADRRMPAAAIPRRCRCTPATIY